MLGAAYLKHDLVGPLHQPLLLDPLICLAADPKGHIDDQHWPCGQIGREVRRWRMSRRLRFRKVTIIRRPARSHSI